MILLMPLENAVGVLVHPALEVHADVQAVLPVRQVQPKDGIGLVGFQKVHVLPESRVIIPDLHPVKGFHGVVTDTKLSR